MNNTKPLRRPKAKPQEGFFDIREVGCWITGGKYYRKNNVTFHDNPIRRR